MASWKKIARRKMAPSAGPHAELVDWHEMWSEIQATKFECWVGLACVDSFDDVNVCMLCLLNHEMQKKFSSEETCNDVMLWQVCSSSFLSRPIAPRFKILTYSRTRERRTELFCRRSFCKRTDDSIRRWRNPELLWYLKKRKRQCWHERVQRWSSPCGNSVC